MKITHIRYVYMCGLATCECSISLSEKLRYVQRCGLCSLFNSTLSNFPLLAVCGAKVLKMLTIHSLFGSTQYLICTSLCDYKQERMSRRRRRRSVELCMPRLGHVVVLHTSKISPYKARGHYVCSCEDLCETQLSRCEIQIGLCAAIVVLELADLHMVQERSSI